MRVLHRRAARLDRCAGPGNGTGRSGAARRCRGGDAVPRRALFCAGGGLKVAYQAGVLEVWLDEVGLEFDHADGVSAGVFNLAMWCQYDSGRRIADNWRGFRPLQAIGVEPRALLPGAPSVLTYGRFRRNILPRWQLDWDRIRGTSRSASFNLFNVGEQQLLALGAAEMDEDRLMAAVSLPLWFPPVTAGGGTD